MPENPKKFDSDIYVLVVLENASTIFDRTDLEKRVEMINHSKDVRASIGMTLVLNEIIDRIKQELPQDQDAEQVWRNINLLQRIEEIKDRLLAPTYSIDKKIQKLNLEICVKITAVVLAMIFAGALNLSALNALLVILATATTTFILIQHYRIKCGALQAERQHLLEIIQAKGLPKSEKEDFEK